MSTDNPTVTLYLQTRVIAQQGDTYATSELELHLPNPHVGHVIVSAVYADPTIVTDLINQALNDLDEKLWAIAFKEQEFAAAILESEELLQRGLDDMELAAERRAERNMDV